MCVQLYVLLLVQEGLIGGVGLMIAIQLQLLCSAHVCTALLNVRWGALPYSTHLVLPQGCAHKGRFAYH